MRANALEINPRSASVLNDLGNVSQDLGNAERSLDYYRRAVEVDPNSVVANCNLGAMLTQEMLFRTLQLTAEQREQFMKMMLAMEPPPTD